jgi:hypothetical protein
MSAKLLSSLALGTALALKKGAKSAAEASEMIGVGLEGAADEDISQADLELAARWAKACTAARQAGFRDLGEAECMYFDVRLS